MLVAEAGGVTQWARGSVNAQLQLRFSIDSVLSVPLVGEDWMGRLFFLDTGRTTVDDLSLARVVGQQVGARLDHYYLVQRLQQAAVTQERVGLGRDLHDGLLQSLTGMALQVHSALRFLREDPLAAEARLVTVQEQILSVQEHLLSFIGELRNALPAGAAKPRSSGRASAICVSASSGSGAGQFRSGWTSTARSPPFSPRMSCISRTRPSPMPCVIAVRPMSPSTSRRRTHTCDPASPTTATASPSPGDSDSTNSSGCSGDPSRSGSAFSRGTGNSS